MTGRRHAMMANFVWQIEGTDTKGGKWLRVDVSPEELNPSRRHGLRSPLRASAPSVCRYRGFGQGPIKVVVQAMKSRVRPLLRRLSDGALAERPASAQVSIPLAARAAAMRLRVQDERRCSRPPASRCSGPPSPIPIPETIGPADGADRPARTALTSIPYNRDIDMTVPLTFQNRSLGDIPMRLTADDRFLLESEGFLRLMRRF